MDDDHAATVGQLLDTPNLAEVLENDRFKQFLDHVPVAIGVAALRPHERIVYINHEFERLTGLTLAGIVDRPWSVLPGRHEETRATLADAIAAGEDHIGSFAIGEGAGGRKIDAWSNGIADDDGGVMFRLVALVETDRSPGADLTDRLKQKDTLLRELQHRVKNNLQMITALIRLETRQVSDGKQTEGFERLAGRVESLALLYQSLSDDDHSEVVDLGTYLSQIASAVMRAHAVEGIHLNLQVDTWPVSIDVAMPTGLVVNELLTNALKHAFVGRDGGTITLHSIVQDGRCRVLVADDGIGLAPGTSWPQPGKLGVLIADSLRVNAKASLAVESTPGEGLRVTIVFAQKDAGPS